MKQDNKDLTEKESVVLCEASQKPLVTRIYIEEDSEGNIVTGVAYGNPSTKESIALLAMAQGMLIHPEKRDGFEVDELDIEIDNNRGLLGEAKVGEFLPASVGQLALREITRMNFLQNKETAQA